MLNDPHHRSPDPRVNSLPITIGNLQRIVGAARTMPHSVDGIPGRLWWPAFVLSIVDTGQHAPVLLELPVESYQRGKGTLAVDGQEIPLHAHTANALEALRDFERDRLFPWPWDGGKAPYYMLYHHYRNLLHRAGLPPTLKRPLVQLRAMAFEAPDVLDCIDPHRPFHPVPGHPERKPKKPRQKKPRIKRGETDGVYLIRDNSPETLKRYFAEVYRPLRLIGGSARTIEGYESVIDLFSRFLGCDASLHHLTDDHLDRFKCWLIQAGRKPVTVNSRQRHLLAIWRHAWKKRRVEEQPRDVEFMREVKRIPEAWSSDEFGQILFASSQADYEMGTVPANRWWPAFLLTLYDTGLRLGAAMSLHSADLNLDEGIILARAETQKQKADQVFRLHPDTVAAIKATHPHRRELLFGYPNWRDNKRTLYNRFNRILKAAGLPTTAGNKFHKIRRTSATLVADAISAEAATKHLGHSHASTTRAYLDLRKIRNEVISADVMERPLWTPPPQKRKDAS